MPEVKQRKSIFVKANLAASSTFSQFFSVGFIPHCMIVTSVSVGSSVGFNGVNTVHMVGFGDLAHFTDDKTISCRNTFDVSRSFEGTHFFEIRRYDEALFALTAELMFIIEFIEFVK